MRKLRGKLFVEEGVEALEVGGKEACVEPRDGFVMIVEITRRLGSVARVDKRTMTVDTWRTQSGDLHQSVEISLG